MDCSRSDRHTGGLKFCAREISPSFTRSTLAVVEYRNFDNVSGAEFGRRRPRFVAGALRYGAAVVHSFIFLQRRILARSPAICCLKTTGKPEESSYVSTSPADCRGKPRHWCRNGQACGGKGL